MIRTLIVDDEETTRNEIRKELSTHYPEVSIVGEATSATEAHQLIVEFKPDLVFLDVMLDKGSGFDLLSRFPEPAFHIVLITANNEYALHAFNYCKLRYIVKPIRPHALKSVLDDLIPQVALQRGQSEQVHPLPGEQRTRKTITVNVSDAIHVVSIGDIIRCEAEKNYTFFNISDGRKILVAKTLKEYDQALSAQGFIRIHQSHLINLVYVKTYIKKTGIIELSNGTLLPVSIRKREHLIAVLSQ
ncbi:MAG: response regulator transcription factor [Flavobacteriales bacterium]|nr:response regulator transcription factor [Flavobacteriales bacterium]MCB9446925.1 response regulator transcription factor [Flavobacteriales bacterium]